MNIQDNTQFLRELKNTAMRIEPNTKKEQQENQNKTNLKLYTPVSLANF